MGIQISVVLTWAEGAILFGNEEKWGGLWGLRWDNASGVQVFFDECFTCFHLLRVQGIDLSDFWSEGWLKIDDMVIGLMWGEFVVSLFGEYILEVLTPVRKGGFLSLCLLSNLGGNGDLSDSFSGKPTFLLSESMGGLQVCIHSQPSQQISLWDGGFHSKGEALT